MPVLKNIGYLATCKVDGSQSNIHDISNAALGWEGSRITWVGKESDLPTNMHNMEAIDAGGKMIVPGLIDCHTHLAFGGWRSDEFEMRIQGKSYLEIARAGGGIASTVKHTREASFQQLVEQSMNFLNEMASLGVTTVECKSGYGLNTDNELKLLKVYEELKKKHRVNIVSTFLGAHIVPVEYRNKKDAYINLIIEEMLPAISRQNLAEFCDVFVEDTAFSIDEARHIFEAGKKYGLTPKLHADQLTSGGGAELAAEIGAVSADHLEYISDTGISAMAEAGVCAVSLPLATLYLNQQPIPSRKLIDAGVPVCVATDFNPGSAPSYDLPLAMMLACNLQRMTPAEVLKSVTINAAKAIKKEQQIGSLEPGKLANFIIIDAPDVNHWMYHYRPNACIKTFINGNEFIKEAL
jgi:imidazolonepropionase